MKTIVTLTEEEMKSAIKDYLSSRIYSGYKSEFEYEDFLFHTVGKTSVDVEINIKEKDTQDE